MVWVGENRSSGMFSLFSASPAVERSLHNCVKTAGFGRKKGNFGFCLQRKQLKFVWCHHGREPCPQKFTHLGETKQSRNEPAAPEGCQKPEPPVRHKTQIIPAKPWESWGERKSSSGEKKRTFFILFSFIFELRKSLELQQ